MSSGFGLKGNVSRCFYFFQDFMICSKTHDDPMNNCGPLKADYMECLHHKKEFARRLAIDQEHRKQKAEAAEELLHPGRKAGGHGHH